LFKIWSALAILERASTREELDSPLEFLTTASKSACNVQAAWKKMAEDPQEVQSHLNGEDQDCDPIGL
jgi:hypothetical protein